MGNSFTAPGGGALHLSNGGTSVLFDTLALAGSALAGSAWQQHLTLYFCDTERQDSGVSGFDLAELPWTGQCAAERDFVVRLLDLAASGHGWDRLHYHPPHVRDQLLAYRELVTGFTPEPVPDGPMGDWSTPPAPDELDRCHRHRVFRGQLDCRLCDPHVQPLDAPRVWELVSRAPGGRRRVLPVPAAAVPDCGTDVIPVAAEQLQRVGAALGHALEPDQAHLLRRVVA